MRKFAVVDCETDPFKYGRTDIQPFVWGLHDENGFRTFKETSDLVRHASQREILLYAHNGGKFDYHFLLDNINTEQEITEIHGRIAKARMGACELRDSYCLFPGPLSDYKKDEIDYDLFERDVRNAHMSEILKYLEGDCFYLYELIEGFRAEYGPHLTLASAALSFWAKHFNNGIKPKLGSREFQARYYADFSPWYFGGRVARPKPAVYLNADISTWDINSAYPAAMMLEHPCGPVCVAGSDRTKGFEQRLYTIEARSEGFFPMRTKAGNEYPDDGEYRVFNVTGWELKAALELGCKLKKITDIKEFPMTVNFKGYIDHFWKLKNKAAKGSGERLWAKLFLNSLYGKFAANPENYMRTFYVDMEKAQAFAAKIGGHMSGTMFSKAVVSAPLLPEQIRYYDVVVGLSVTGCVRATLMKAIKQNSAHYWDTDCIHKFGQTFIGDAGNKLGQWQKEFKATRAAYFGPKGYALADDSLAPAPEGYKFASKGFQLKDGSKQKDPKKAALECETSFNTVANIAQGGTYKAEKAAPTFNMRGGLRYIARNIRAIKR